MWRLLPATRTSCRVGLLLTLLQTCTAQSGGSVFTQAPVIRGSDCFRSPQVARREQPRFAGSPRSRPDLRKPN
jgi:hypothetical protein